MVPVSPPWVDGLEVVCLGSGKGWVIYHKASDMRLIDPLRLKRHAQEAMTEFGALRLDWAQAKHDIRSDPMLPVAWKVSQRWRVRAAQIGRDAETGEVYNPRDFYATRRPVSNSAVQAAQSMNPELTSDYIKAGRGAMNYGQEIRKLADEYMKLTGESAFTGVEHRGQGAPEVYMFSDRTLHTGPEALGHMRELLRKAKRLTASYYVAAGDVRGDCGHKHRTASTAYRCAAEDMRAVKSGHGQSAYSDRDVWEVADDGQHVYAVTADGERIKEGSTRIRRVLFGG
jgi:hypothetical protein